LDRGLEIYGGITTNLKKSNQSIIPGAEAFRLYDTYGFPVDLTKLMAREDGFTVDIDGFIQEMEQQRDRARKAQKFGPTEQAFLDTWMQQITEGASSEFIGYEQLECDAEIRKFFSDSERVRLTLNQTPFYAESGGQVGDQGRIEGDGFIIEIDDTIWAGDDILHIGRLIQGGIPDKPNPKVYASVYPERRQSIQRNHTVTHLLQAALRKLYGMHVHQAGSLVHPDYLRFDYTHVQKATDEDIEQVERQINGWVQANIPLHIKYTTFTQAKQEGVIAIFGEKYGEQVRVVEVPGVSKELCGGCHVRATGDIGLVKIRSETAAAAGIRRIDAVTGSSAILWMQEQSRTLAKMQDALLSYGSDPYEKLLKILDERRALEHDLQILKSQLAASSIDSILQRVKEFNGIKYLCERVSVASMDDLKNIGDLVRDKLSSGIGILGAVLDGRPGVVCVATPDLIQNGIDVVTVAKAIGKRMGGGGGGRPQLATAGGKDPALLDSVLQHCEDIFREVNLGK
jgi:alanyl-tRNA synthetase